MYNVLKLNKIAAVGTDRLGENYNCADEVAAPDAILVRSASMHDMELPEGLLAIARAGAGVNNIPLDKCSEKGICVFNTPGANANAVKELVIAGLLLSSRKIVNGIEWVKTLKGNGNQVGKMVEKGKSQFAGPEILGKKLGVIGLGAIGILAANAAAALGMQVYGTDPYLSVNNALKISPDVNIVKSQEEIFEQCDYITIHVPLTADTKDMVNENTIAKMKDGVRILNYSRDGLVNTADLLKALENGKVSAYVTDFATDDILGVDGVIAMPHLGASTPESEDNCAVMAADEIKEYLENGNIINSVNFPAISAAKTGSVRYCVFSKEDEKLVPAVINAIGTVAGVESKSRNGYTYTIVDTDNGDAKAAVEAIDGVIRVRVI